MDPYTLSSIFLTLTVLIAFINHHTFKVQMTIAVMVGSLMISLFLIVLQHAGIANLTAQTRNLLIQTNFHQLLVNGMLSFLLFAGSMTIDFKNFKEQIREIASLASLGTIASATLIGLTLYALLPLFHSSLPFSYCLLFGALISPTDPIAVIATFKEIKAPKKLETCIAGESLFNDGIGIVIFITLYQLTFQGVPVTFNAVSLLFLQQTVGGILYGALLGLITRKLIMTAKDSRIEILITLAVVTGGYQLTLAMGVSGPLAMVVSGIFVGNALPMSSDGKSNPNELKTLHLFWEIIDDILNAILFLLIGFELLAIPSLGRHLLLAATTIPIILLIRLIVVALPISYFQRKQKTQPYAIAILTWGGLRGGLAVALALSLPPSHYRDLILSLTFAVVSFSVIVQGLSIKPLAKLAKEKSLRTDF